MSKFTILFIVLSSKGRGSGVGVSKISVTLERVVQEILVTLLSKLDSLSWKSLDTKYYGLYPI